MRLKPLRRIGEGTFSAVFLCRRTRTGQLFAVKVLKRVFSEDEELPLEVVLLNDKRLQHPNIIRLHEHFVTGGGRQARQKNRGKGGDSLLSQADRRMCLVFDYCECGTLFETIRKARSSNANGRPAAAGLGQAGGRGLALPVARDLLQGLLSALAHLHSAGWVHRDVKPENIMVRELGGVRGSPARLEAVLGDLGSCRREPTCPPATVAQSATTAVGEGGAGATEIAAAAPFATDYIGTRWYRAPEVLLTDGRYGTAMDVWAIGCVGFEMLAAEPLFPGTDELSQVSIIHDLLGAPCRDAAVLALVLPTAAAAASAALSSRRLKRMKRSEARRRKNARLAVAAAVARRCRVPSRERREVAGRGEREGGGEHSLAAFAEILCAGLEYFATDRATAAQLLSAPFFLSATRADALAQRAGIAEVVAKERATDPRFGAGKPKERRAADTTVVEPVRLDHVAALVTETTREAALCAKGRTLRRVRSNVNDLSGLEAQPVEYRRKPRPLERAGAGSLKRRGHAAANEMSTRPRSAPAAAGNRPLPLLDGKGKRGRAKVGKQRRKR